MRTESLKYLQGWDGLLLVAGRGRVGRRERTAGLIEIGVGESEAVSGFESAAVLMLSGEASEGGRLARRVAFLLRERSVPCSLRYDYVSV
jgi:hypothetical protein